LVKVNTHTERYDTVRMNDVGTNFANLAIFTFLIVIPFLPPAFPFFVPPSFPFLLLLPDPPQAPTILRILPPLTNPILLTTEFSERSTIPTLWAIAA